MRRIYERPRYRRWHWHGTLLEDKRNETGTYYRRNRTYDPSTGRFTQEDPIGLAGGLNVYGFAAGDPVSYDDPFGLKVCGRTHTLRRGIEQAVNADIQWDADGCVSNLSAVIFGGGNEWAVVQEVFGGMVTSNETWTVAPGTQSTIGPLGCPQGRCSWYDHANRTAYVFTADYGREVLSIDAVASSVCS